MATRHVLCEAADLLRGEVEFDPSVVVADERGKDVKPGFPFARRFSLGGAIRHVCFGAGRGEGDIVSAMAALRRSLGGKSVVIWERSGVTQADAIALLDRAATESAEGVFQAGPPKGWGQGLSPQNKGNYS